MKLAIVGTRGVPAAYGGFETLAEELSTRLAARGHDVTVYARAHGVSSVVADYRGVRVVHLPTLKTKYFDTVVHAALSGLHAATQGYDAVLVCNGANALLCRLPRLLGAPTRIVLNVDGLERNRRKWNALGKLVYALSERLSCVMPDSVVTDARSIETYYRETYRKESFYIPYGSDLAPATGRATLDKLGLAPGGYVFYVSRFEPENNADAVLRAYRLVKGDTKLVLLGAAPYAGAFLATIQAEAAGDPRVLLPGAIYGAPYHELLANAAVYVHATEVGGTHPALVEAMGFGRPLVVHDTPENRETAGDAALYVDARRAESLAAGVTALLSDAAARERSGRAARARARSLYLWDSVADDYEALLAGSWRPGRPLSDARMPGPC
jgi:glycosyltransferase involved in cell wall biosynthesis